MTLRVSYSRWFGLLLRIIQNSQSRNVHESGASAAAQSVARIEQANRASAWRRFKCSKIQEPLHRWTLRGVSDRKI